MNKNKTNVQLIVLLLIFSVIAGFSLLTQNFKVGSEIDKLSFNNYVIADRTNKTGTVAGAETEKAKITFDRGMGTVTDFDVNIEKGRTTVLDLLKSLNYNMNLGLRYKQYDAGVLIESLFGTNNGADGKYWQYYVNGQLSMNAVDQQRVNDGDKIEFKFEESNF